MTNGKLTENYRRKELHLSAGFVIFTYGDSHDYENFIIIRIFLLYDVHGTRRRTATSC